MKRYEFFHPMKSSFLWSVILIHFASLMMVSCNLVMDPGYEGVYSGTTRVTLLNMSADVLAIISKDSNDTISHLAARYQCQPLSSVTLHEVNDVTLQRDGPRTVYVFPYEKAASVYNPVPVYPYSDFVTQYKITLEYALSHNWIIIFPPQQEEKIDSI